jgi:hypothetical protein
VAGNASSAISTGGATLIVKVVFSIAKTIIDVADTMIMKGGIGSVDQIDDILQTIGLDKDTIKDLERANELVLDFLQNPGKNSGFKCDDESLGKKSQGIH